MTREEYRKEMILEQDKQELANNCRLAIDSFLLGLSQKIEKRNLLYRHFKEILGTINKGSYLGRF